MHCVSMTVVAVTNDDAALVQDKTDANQGGTFSPVPRQTMKTSSHTI